MDDEDDDMTKDMDDPTPEPNVTEVNIQGSKIQPNKGSSYLDLDEENMDKGDKTDAPVSINTM